MVKEMAIFEAQHHHAYKLAAKLILNSLNKKRDEIDNLEEADMEFAKENSELITY